MEPEARGPEVMVTERLRLRPLVYADAEALFAIKSDPSVTKCYGLEPHQSLERTRDWVGGIIEDQRRGGVLFWVLELGEENEVIGACCLWNFNGSRTCAEVGYELRADQWGKGLMTEAISELLDRSFDELGLHRVEANPLASNAASIALLLKLGFRQEGVLRQRQLVGGHFVDQWYLGLLKGDRPGKTGR